jgi:NADH dehydrogenase/putative oxidoreductase
MRSRHFRPAAAGIIIISRGFMTGCGRKQSMTEIAVPRAARSRYAPAAERVQHVLSFLDGKLGPVLDLVVRLWLAQTFLASGMVKTLNWDTTVYLYTHEHPVPGLPPEVAAALGTTIEIVCPLLLIAGFATRLAALPLLLTALFLQLTYLSLDTHVYWILLLALLMARGAGALSVDHAIAPHLAGSALPFTRSFTRLAADLRLFVLPAVLLVARLWIARQVIDDAVAVFAAGAPALSLLAAGPAAFAAALLALGALTPVAALTLLALAPAVVATPPGSDDPVLLTLLLGGLLLRGPGSLAVDARLRPTILRFLPSLSGDTAWLAGAPRVVVVGAGFGGIAAVEGLRHAWARVTLIDRRNYHLFQPLLYQVATASLSPADVATPIRGLLRGQANARVLMERVTAVDVAARVVVAGGRRVPYDFLVLATGARHSYFGKDDWEPLAPGLKKIDDATAMRGRILAAFERAESRDDEAERRRLLTFVIVGGGPTGVELAGAIAELAHHGMRDEFRSIDPATARVILVQSAPRLLPAMPERLSADARAALERLGVDVRVNAKVEHIDDGGVLVGGERIEAATVLWAAGVAASAAGRWIGAERDRSGRIVVNRDLSVPGRDGIYAIGDTAACPGDDGAPLPGLAAVAKQQGRHVARILRACIEGRPDPGPFRYRNYGSMATIGRKAAVADFPGIRLSGSLAWWLWGVVHVAFLVDVRSRIAVLVDWFWSYLTYNRGMRLITGNESGVD